MGFSSSRTGDFLRLAKKLDELPQLKRELEQGKVGYTQAREIIKVAQPDNEKQWLEEARKTTRDGLAKKVKLARDKAKVRKLANPNQGTLLTNQPADIPVAAVRHRVNFEMSTEQFARYEALWEKLYKLGGIPVGADKCEILLEGLAELIETFGSNNAETTIKPPVQIHIHQCPECKAASTTTSRGEAKLGAKELERMECDAQIDEPGKPNKTTVPPSVRRKALSRDRHQCQANGCNNTRFLEVHHIIPRIKGGSNRLGNLVTFCGACHQLLHDRGHKFTNSISGNIFGDRI